MIPKIKDTKKGNVQITMSREHANAIRDMVGGTNEISRRNAHKRHNNDWSAEQDSALLEIYDLIG